jgi:glycosyltransferase involved in cell wall biosynthesis
MVAGQRSMTPMTGRASIWASRLTRRFCHRIVAVSDAVVEELVRAEGARREGIVVIGNGVDAELFRPGDRAEARRRLGLDPDALTVGAVGRLAVEKGYHHLLDALARVRRAGQPLELALIGGGGEGERLADQARELEVAGAVHFLGVRQELQELYPAFDLFALPSLEEGSPMALLEAMACALPSVATRVGGVPEAVEDGRSGLLVPAADPEALATALTRLATDPDLRHRLGRAARRRVEESLSLERVVRSYEELWEGLAVSRAD